MKKLVATYTFVFDLDEDELRLAQGDGRPGLIAIARLEGELLEEDPQVRGFLVKLDDAYLEEVPE